MNRLSILDPLLGNQPMQSPDGRLWIIYNGEIYNHQDLRPDLERAGWSFRTQCDTETVLAAFWAHGPECLTMFNGMFAFAIWDGVNRRLFAARDRLGIKPLYFHEGDDVFALASEPKALLPLLDRPTPNWPALSRYLLFGYLPTPDCAFSSFHKLQAGHYAWIEQGNINLSRYYQPQYGQGEAIPEHRLLDELNTRLEQAVESELLSDVPLGVFLSGGLDSSAVAAFAAQRKKHMLSFALKFEEGTHDESSKALRVARHLGLEHRELLFDRELALEAFEQVAATLDEPFADSTVLPLLMLSQFARKSVKVALTGWGGDEIFAGYPTYKAHRMAAPFKTPLGLVAQSMLQPLVRNLPVSDSYMSFEFKAKRFLQGMNLSPALQHCRWMGYFQPNELPGILRPAIWEECKDHLETDLLRFIRSMHEQEPVDQAMHLDCSYFLEGNGLFQADRMTMAASLEGRVPLLNPLLVDWMNALPWRQKMPGGKLKGLLKQALSPLLPRDIIEQPKKGFGPPTSQWLRTLFRSTLEKTFSEQKIREQGVFEYDFIQRLIHEHLARRADHGRKLWALLSLQTWHDRFID